MTFFIFFIWTHVLFAIGIIIERKSNMSYKKLLIMEKEIF